MNQTPLISVIVPCYNQAQYLDECLQSVYDQTYQNWECIIVNDGSPDNTEEIVLQWTKKDARFNYLKKENGGLSSARNAGIDIAKGEWIQFLDSDDYLATDKLENASKYFENYDLVISNYQMFNEKSFLPDYCSFINRNIDYKSIVLDWDISFTIPIHCGVFRKSKISKFHQELKAKEDWVFWVDFLKITDKVKLIHTRQAFYRTHLKSMTKDVKLLNENEIKALLIIFNKLDDNFKQLFFKSRLESKNDLINVLSNELLINKNKLNSKRYIILNKILRLINK